MRHPTVMESLTIRAPSAIDGSAVNALIERCPPLDTNSTYCNLLQCAHFSDTSVLVERDSKVIGFISGYLIPKQANTLFIWQVAVCESARGMGLASTMLNTLLQRKHLRHVEFVETTITETNTASWKLFKRLARETDCELVTQVMFDKERHFKGQHETEMLVRIGSLATNN